jgi:alpha-tubulin suppressor-like RCC1 family protein
MKRALSLCFITAVTVLLLLPGSASATVAPTSNSTFLLHREAAGKGQVLQLTGTAAALTSRSVWQGALASSAQLACGSFTGGIAEAAVLVPTGKHGARLELFRAQPNGSYAPLTVWHAVKAGFTVAATHLTAADVSGDGRDELLVLVPLGKRGAEILGFSFSASAAKEHVLWKAGKVPFALTGAQLAATDLSGDGKVDLALFSHRGRVGHLYGFLSAGARLTLTLRWQGRAAAATYLAAGPVAGSAKGAAFLLSRSSSSQAKLTSLTPSGHGFTASTAWSGSLALRGAQLACTALGSDGSGDVLVLTGSSRAVTLTALLPTASGFSVSRCWKASGVAVASLRFSAAPSGACVLAPSTIVLAGADAAQLTAVSADDSTLTFSGGAPAGAALGEVLLVEPCAAAPDGLLRKVTAVSTSGSVTTVTTTSAALSQAFSSLDLSLSRQLSSADLAGARLAPGVHLVAGGRRLSNGSISLPTFTLSLNHDFAGLGVQGTVTLAERVDIDASISQLGLQSAYVASVATEKSTLACTASAGWQDDGEVDLPLALVPIDVAGVPMTINIELALKTHGDFAVGIKTSVDQTASFTIGARYANGSFSPVCSPGFTASCTPPTLYGTTDLRTSIGPQVSVMICGVAGPDVGVDAYSEFFGDAAAKPWWTLHGGLEGSVDFNMPSLSDTLADWSYSQTFYDHVFAQSPSSREWAAVSTGDDYTLAVKRDGTLWAWGANDSGQLGLDNTVQRDVPTEVGSEGDWAAVSAAGGSTLALKADGSLWAWGYNGVGQLGLGSADNDAHPTPRQVGSARDWAAVSAGEDGTLALKKDGTLWAWGLNDFGQLGIGPADDNAHPTPIEVGSESDWAAVSAGFDYTMALKTDGTLWAWGSNRYGKLGLGDITDRDTPTQVGSAGDWAAVSTSTYDTLALKQDGTLWAWGLNNFGQLGLGSADSEAHTSPTQVGSAGDWAAVSDAGASALALKKDGTLWAWGYNEKGELGLGDTTRRDAPTEVGSATDWAAVSSCVDFTLAIKNDGTLWAWGFNSSGQLGLGGAVNYNAHPTPTKVDSGP